jgi:anti-anti-sigma regulatory factor
MCEVQPQILEVFIITKLNKLFRIVDRQEDAVASMADTWAVSCPVPGCRGLARFGRGALAGSAGHTCAECGCRFVLGGPTESGGGRSMTASVTDVWVPTYDGEHVRVVPGRPYRVEVAGRLDLFASAALEQAWAAVPAPRRVVVDLSRATDVTEAGLRALAAACGPDDLVALVARPAGQPAGVLLPTAASVHPSQAAAAAALGDIPEPSCRPLQVTVRPSA